MDFSMSKSDMSYLVELDRRCNDLFDRHEYENALQLCASVLSQIPTLSVLDRDHWTYCYCINLFGVCFDSKGKRFVTEYFQISSSFLLRLEQSDCKLNRIEDVKCQIYSNRVTLFHLVNRYEEVISEATIAININPKNRFSIMARIKRCNAYDAFNRMVEMKMDLDELQRLQRLQRIPRGHEENILRLSAACESKVKGKDYNELVAQKMASFQSNASVYHPDESVDWNVNQLFFLLKVELDLVSKNIVWENEVCLNRLSIPQICSSRKYVDILVHLLFSVDEQKRFPKISPIETARTAVLRISDMMKNPLILSAEVKSRMVRGELCSVQFFDDRLDFLPSEGVIIAYHLLLNCELCSPCLFRWIVSDGIIIHSDRQEIPSIETFLADISFLPSLFHPITGRPLLRDPRWSNQVDVCRRLYATLLGGLESFLSSSRHIIFVPDIHLFRVSFGCLLDTEEQYLIENHSFSVSSSIRLIRMNQEQKTRLLLGQSASGKSGSGESKQIGVLVCGHAMVSDAGTSVVDLVRYLQDDQCIANDGIVVLSESLFTPSRFQASCRLFRPRLIHVVAHGSDVDVSDDEKSSDILSQFRIQGEMSSADGTVICARDIAWKYDLTGTDLVFLNSCQVGYGKLQKTGVLGFNNACFQAGCPSVISSLWDVLHGISRAISQYFYLYYLTGLYDKSESLRYAIVDFLKQHRHVAIGGTPVRVRLNPALWASYQLFGNPL